MRYYAGLDVSVKETSVCILDETGRVCLERKVASDPADLALVLQDPRWPLHRVGLEAVPCRNGCMLVSLRSGCPSSASKRAMPKPF